MEDGKQNSALIIRDVYKKYNDETVVLNGFSMTVPKATIYGLLGPSGCGKTTLLRSIVGLADLDSGFVHMSTTTRSHIGYMPQNLCLHDQMSILENCYFYGYLYGMSNQNIRSRVKELLTLLDLPYGSRLVKDLSGGQQKRVSLCVTFIHDPRILLLDEPTVGLDPLLIESLWKWFLQMAAEGKTIIITTHYIQEANQAHKIALMRNGVLLTEKAPSEVMKELACTNLEDAFLKLSYEQERGTRSWLKTEYPQEIKPIKVRYKDDEKFPTQKLLALTYKNAVLLKRDYILTSFILLLPGITMILSNLSIGGNLRNLKIGVVNEEVPLSVCHLYNNSNCFSDNDNVYLSCLFLQFLKAKSFVLVEYTDMKAAEMDVQKSKVSAVLYIPRNYTISIDERLENGREIDEETLDRTFLDVYIDYSNPFAETYIKRDLAYALDAYFKQVMTACDLNPKVVLIPLKFETPIFGSQDDDFTTYGINGIMALSCFFFPAFMALVHVYIEKSGGITERVMVTGISRNLIITALLCFLTLLFIIELIEILSVAYIMFQRPLKGSVWTVISLLLLDGISGLLLGFLLAVMYDDLMLSTFTASGFLLALGYLTGLMWPIEGQHYLLRSINWMFPLVKPILSLRDINLKGRTIKEFSVLGGYLSTIQWMCVFLIGIYFYMRKKQ